MLNPDFKEKWLTALESGQYQQTTGVLHDGSNYCCLGVACVILGATFINKSDDDDTLAEGYGWRPMLNDEDLGGEGGDEAFSYEGLELAGLTQEEQTDLYKMNDRGKTFVEIADYIRKNL